MSERIIYAEENESGEYIAHHKVQVIINEMKPFFENLEEEMRKKASWRNQPAWSMRVKNKLNSIMRKYKTMPNADAVRLTNDDIFASYTEFIDLIFCINEYCDYVPSKQDFCAYTQISVDAYNDLLANGTDDQRLILREVENYLADLQLDGAQGGVVKEKSTEFRLTAKDFGHSIVKKPNIEEAASVMNEQYKSQDYWLKIVNGIIPPTIEEKKANVKKLKSTKKEQGN